MANPVFTLYDGDNKQTFDGFCHVAYQHIVNCPPEWAEFLALVSVEGEIEAWWIANRDQAIEELQRYYRMTMNREMSLRIFKRV